MLAEILPVSSFYATNKRGLINVDIENLYIIQIDEN